MRKVRMVVHGIVFCLLAIVIITGFLQACSPKDSSNPHDQDPLDNMQIFRTAMPHAGPSAFAIRFKEDSLALCYDPVRGGVNYVWFGDFNLGPTFAGKINELAEIEGNPFYRETKWHPLRLDTVEAKMEYNFRGYTVQNGVLEFRYIIGDNIHGSGVDVRERITAIKNGIRRNFEVNYSGELYLWIESQNQAFVSVEGDTIKGDEWVQFSGQPLRSYAITIESKKRI